MNKYQAYWQFLLVLCIGSIVFSCQNSGNRKKFGDPQINASLRYLQYNGELSGTWSFYQRNQLDSLVPDAQLHTFVINGQKVTSEKTKNNYHMYMVADTLMSQNLNVQISPSNQVISISIPEIPKVTHNLLQPGKEWEFHWPPSDVLDGDSLSFILTDTTSQTLISKTSLSAGQIIIPAEKTYSLMPGAGFYYLISEANLHKDLKNLDFYYHMEVYSKDFPIKIEEPNTLE